MNLFLRLVPIVGMFTLLAILACGTTQEGPGSSSSANPAATGDKYGGTLRVQVHLDPTGVDLHTPRGASSREFWIAQPALNYLVTEKLGSPGVIVPDLAEGWEVSLNGDGTADWTFKLDSDAKWHNGDSVTPADIKFNFDRVKNPPEGLTIGRARPVGTYYDNVDDVKIDGKKYYGAHQH
jgi:ABC-type transport system substrate-binding protein